MPGPALHETRMGMRFFEVTAPRIADELATLNNNLAALISVLRDRLPAAPRPPSAPRPSSPADATAPVHPKR